MIGYAPRSMMGTMQNTPSIKDLARFVGLSVAQTTSALAGRADVAPATRERVLAAVAQIGYKRRAERTPSVRFQLNTRLGTSEYAGTKCVEWTGHKSDGYGQFKVNGRDVHAHRWIYEQTHGPIPPDRPYIDHLCRNRACVNVRHLEAVTFNENIRRGAHGVLKTHCIKGHPLSGDNLGLARGGRERVCLKCKRARGREAQRRYMAKRRTQ